MSFLPGLFAGGFAIAVAAPFLDLLAFLAVEHENAKNAEATKSSLMVWCFKIVGFY